MKRHQQQGFVSLISMLFVLSVIGYLLVAFAQKQKQEAIVNNQNSFYGHVVSLMAQINQYQSDQYANQHVLPDSEDLFPQSFAQLQSKGYLPPCSTQDNKKGYCMKPEQTPWGNAITYRRQKVAKQAYYEALMSITLPPESVANRFELQTSLSLFSKLSGVTYDAPRRTLTVHIPRLENLLSLTALVKRSGQHSTLTGDWDVGGSGSIVNAKDIQIRNTDGSQRSLARGVVDSFVVRSGKPIDRPQCVAGLTSDIVMVVKQILSPNPKTEKFAAVKVTKVTTPKIWTPHLSYQYQDVTGKWQSGATGSLLVTTVCH